MATLGTENRTLLDLRRDERRGQARRSWRPRTRPSGPTRASTSRRVAGGVEQLHRRRAAGRVDHHPAVRARGRRPQGRDVLPQAREAVMAWKLVGQVRQGADPRVLPQHRPLRTRRLRHRGGRPGVLRQDRQPQRAGRAAGDAGRGDGAGGHGQAAEARPGRPRRRARLRPDPQRRRRSRTPRAGGSTSARAWSRTGGAHPGRGRRPGLPGHGRALDDPAAHSRAGRADRPGREPRAERAPPDRPVPGQDQRLHPERRLPDRHHDRQAGPGRGRGGGRHPPADDTGGAARPAGQLAGRPGRRRAGHRPGARLLRRQRTAPAPTTPAGTSTRTAPRSASASTRRARRSRSTTWPRRCGRTSRWSPSGTRRRPRSSPTAAASTARRPARCATPPPRPASPTARSSRPPSPR